MTYLNYLGQPVAESASGPGVFGSGAGGETLTAPTGPSSVDGNGGGDVLIGSNGDNTFIVRDPNDLVRVAAGSAGVKTVTAFLSYSLPANVQNLTSSGALNYAAGNSLDNLIKVGNDGETLYGGPGNDVLVGGFANDTFIVRSGEGNDVIYGFHAGDTIRLMSPSLPNFQAVQAAMTQVGSDVSIHIDGSEQLIVRNMTIGQFTASNFLLTLDRSQLGAATLDDEFNSFQPYNFQTHTGTWRTDFGLGRDNPNTFRLVQNGEQQDYVTAEFQGSSGHALGYNPFSDANGVLTITARPFSQTDSQQSLGASFASGMINTKGIFEQQYGYFEIRAQLPTAPGAWPAFWMVPDPNGNGVEADITENIAIKPNIDFVRAYASGNTAFGNVLKVGDLSGFHTYGMLWTPQTVTFYYDDQAVYQTATPASWNQPMYLIANLAVGGFGGNPDASQFPASFNIDYIHAYALANGSSVVHNLTPASMDPPPQSSGGTGGSGGSGVGTAGDDNLQAFSGATSIDGGAGNDTIGGWSGGDYLRGGDGNDVIHGGTGFDDINGNKGDDTIDGGGSGGDWLVGGQGNDVINGQSDFSILYGNLGNDTLNGGSGNEWLRGGQGDDQISGGAGNDWISGDRGNDTESGGAGADTFNGFSGIGTDRITDFHLSEGDRIQLDPGTHYTVSQVGADTVIDLGGGDEMILVNVQMSTLTPGWIFGF